MAPPRLFLRFALFAGLALVAAVGLALLLARWNVNDRARSRALGEATAVAHQFASDDLSRTAFDAPRTGGVARRVLPPFLDLFFAPTVAAEDPAQVVLYSPRGIVTYASDHSLIGTHATDLVPVEAALRHAQYAVENGVQYAYVPGLSDFGAQRARGVLRLERNYAPIAAEIHSDFLTQAMTVALALGFLYLAMLPIMRRVTLGLRRGYVERAELAAIVDHSNDAVIALSSDGAITSWNAGAETVYGWKAEDVLGQTTEFLSPDLDGARTPSGTHLARTAHVRQDGTHVDVSVTISPIRDDHGELVGSSITARDVTELERLDRELREAHRQEAIGRLAGGISRDFGEVLDEIDTAAANLLVDPSSRRDLDAIRAATARGSSLADQLLAVGGAQHARPALIDLNGAIESARAQLHELVGVEIEVAMSLHADLGSVFADREQIEQLILNLGASARASMPAGGRITIETKNVDFARRGRGDEDDPGHYVMVAVTDTGASMPPGVRDRPFEPFVHRGDGGERMALGLAAACGIVKQSGGTMGIESRPGGGTVIRIYLPRIGATQALAPDVPELLA